MAGRVPSIDVLRGADMVMLAGGAPLLLLLLKTCCGDSLPAGVEAQFRHAAWGGPFTCWDMVMPLFLFVAGASMPFAFEKYREHYGVQWRSAARRRVLRRVAVLFVAGMAVQGNLLAFDAAHLSLFCNTLQAIAAGYLLAALFLAGGSVLWQVAGCAGMSALYGGLLLLMPYGGHAGGRFLPQDNLAYYLDCALQGHLQDGTPYTWILTSLSFGSLTLLGVLGGQALRRLSPLAALLPLVAGGAGCLAAACLAEPYIPLIKHIFTPTMVLWSGGWCLLLLALFHLIFDLSPRTYAWGLPFYAFGSNAIAAYLLTNLPGVNGHTLWWGIAHPLLGGFCALFGGYGELVFRALSLLLLWGLLELLRRRHCLLRV